MSESYYNTTRARGQQLVEFESQAKTQEQAIAGFFLRNRGLSFAPSEVQCALGLNAPLTSVRRAISNLTKRGALVRTDQQSKGPYGRPESRWRLRDN